MALKAQYLIIWQAEYAAAVSIGLDNKSAAAQAIDKVVKIARAAEVSPFIMASAADQEGIK